MAQLLADANAADPILPGSSFIFEATQTVTPPATPGDTVFVPFTADWGPDGQVIPFDTFSDFIEGSTKDDGDHRTTYGGFSNADSQGRRAVFGAFLGEGVAGRGGAGRVLGFRLCASSAAKATKTLLNTAAANALTLTARYKGTRGNLYSFTVRASLTLAGGNDLVVIDPDGREAEVYPHTTTDVAALAASVNANPKSAFTATSVATGVALAAIVGSSAAGGNSGLVYTSGDYTAMLAGIEYEPFGVFAAVGLTDSTIITALRAWREDVKTRGKSLRLVVGGALGETFASHKTRANGYNDDGVIAFGTGSIVDTTLTADGSPTTVSTADGVARVAGAIARRGGQLDMVNVRFSGWSIAAGTGATRAQAEVAATQGMTLLTRDGDAVAPTKINLGVTSYYTSSGAKPFKLYSVVKFMRTIDALEDALIADQEGGADELIDGRGIDPKQRDLVRGRAVSVIKDFIRDGLLLEGSTVDFDPMRPYSATDTVVPLVYDARLVPGLRGIRNRIKLPI